MSAWLSSPTVNSNSDRPADDVLVSIVVPCYNVELWLEACLRSILAQTHRRIEVIAVNDRSTDGTGVILAQLSKEDDRLQVLDLPVNVGLHAARCAGLRVAKGSYIGFVDGDDKVRPDMFGSMLQAAEKYAADIAMVGYQEVHPNSGEVLRDSVFNVLEEHGSLILEKYVSGYFRSGVIWNKLYRRELIMDNALVELDRSVDSGADYIVGFGCFAAARKVVVLPGVGYAYMSYRDSMSRGGSNARRFATLLRCYASALTVYQGRFPDAARYIDRLYMRQFRFENYNVSDLKEFEDVAKDLSRSMEKLAVIHPASAYSLVHAFDLTGEPEPPLPLRYHLGAVRRSLAAAWSALRNGRH